MPLSKNRRFLILVLLMIPLSGCALMQIPGAIIGTAGNLLSGAISLAKKVPWWMWL